MSPEQLIKQFREIGEKKLEMERDLMRAEVRSDTLKQLGLKVIESARFFLKEFEELLLAYEDEFEVEGDGITDEMLNCPIHGYQDGPDCPRC